MSVRAHPRRPRRGLRQPCDEFGDAVDRFCVAAADERGWADGTIATARSAVRRFLFAVEDAGVTAVSELTRRVVSGVVTNAAQRYAGGLGSWLFDVRTFLRHLHAVGATATDLSLSVPRLPAPRRVVREGFTAEEVRALTEDSQHGTAIDRRDRAIMTLAAQSGLRACDLARLRRSDIDWRNREIRVVQRKTGRALRLPLEVDSGNAIADYLLSCRVVGDSPYLFVCADVHGHSR
jgi:integrase